MEKNNAISLLVITAVVFYPLVFFLWRKYSKDIVGQSPPALVRVTAAQAGRINDEAAIVALVVLGAILFRLDQVGPFTRSDGFFAMATILPVYGAWVYGRCALSSGRITINAYFERMGENYGIDPRGIKVPLFVFSALGLAYIVSELETLRRLVGLGQIDTA